MSDSDDDAAFASADEGDEVATSPNKSSTQTKSTAVTEPVEKDKTSQKNAHKAVSSKSDNSKNASSSGNEGKKSAIKTESGKPEETVKATPAATSQSKNSKNKKGKKKKEKFAKEKKQTGEMPEQTAKLTEQTEDAPGQTDGDTNKMDEASALSEEPEIQTNECTNQIDKIQDTKRGPDTTQNESAKSVSEGSGDQKTRSSDVSCDELKSVKDKTSPIKEAETDDTSKLSAGNTGHTPKSALDKLTDNTKEKSSGWGWSSWGSTLMDVASTSVSTFGNQLGDGFSTIIDTMESTLGAPSPEELAQEKPVDRPPEEGEQIERETNDGKQEKPEEKISTESEQKTTAGGNENASGDGASGGGASGGGGWFSSWGVSSITSVVQNTTNMVQNTSKSLVTGSLDVLETIGKKTFEVIQEQDPGLQKTKGVLFDKGNKTNLSQLLREAKEEAEVKVEMEKHQEEARKANFGAMFDEYQGLAHLEALEILSNQCEKTVQSLLVSLPEESLKAIKTELIMIKQVFEKDEDESEDEELEHDFSKLVTEYLSELHLGTTPDKLNKAQEKIRQSIINFYDDDETKEDDKMDAKSMHQTAIQSLAILTAKSVEQFHKAGELIVLQKDTNKTFLERAKCLSSLTDVLCTEVRIISTKFCHCLNKISDDDDEEEKAEVKSAITNIYLEASNSSTYIFDAFQLLLPCLQQAAIQTSTILSS